MTYLPLVRTDRRHKVILKEIDACALTGQGHDWKCSNFVKYVDRGTCDCGAVRFFPNELGEFAYKQAEIYNQKYGKPGQVYKGLPVVKKEGKNMVETMTASQETPNPDTPHDIKSGLPPVPPRPKKRKLIWKYFEDNKEAILHDYQNLKLMDFFVRWHMATTTWQKLKRDWGIQGQRTKALSVKLATEPEKPEKPAEAEVSKGDQSKPESTPAGIDKLIYPGKFTVEATSELPDFPTFDDNWPKETQLGWFNTGVRRGRRI